MSTKPTTSQNSKAAETVNAFLVELSALQVRTEAIARLRSGVVVKQLSGLDKNSGELRAKVSNLMNQIEANFRIIRRKLGS